MKSCNKRMIAWMMSLTILFGSSCVRAEEVATPPEAQTNPPANEPEQTPAPPEETRTPEQTPTSESTAPPETAASPETTASPEATASPEVTASPAPAQETPSMSEPTAKPVTWNEMDTLPENWMPQGEAWAWLSDGTLVSGGKLQSLLNDVLDSGKRASVYLMTDEEITVKGIPAEVFERRVLIQPDPRMYDLRRYQVSISIMDTAERSVPPLSIQVSRIRGEDSAANGQANEQTGTPANTPADDPTNTPENGPADDPTNTPENSPADDPTNTPGDGSADGPANTPGDDPADGPANTPGDGPGDDPTNTPGNDPADDPTNTPGDGSADDPTNTPGDDPTTATPGEADRTETPTPTDEPTPAPTDEPTPAPTDEPTPAPTDEPTPVPTVVPALPLRVEAENLTPDVWKNVAPTFTLSGIEQDSEEYVYGVFICDERLVLLSKGTDVYQPEDEGEVHLRFAVLDMMGDVVALSDQYDMLLDFTPPEEPVLNGLEIDGENFAQFPLMDAGSGVDAYSMDGGETWRTPDEGEEIHLFWGAFGDVVDPGRIQVRDKAGNIAMNAEAYTFGEVLFVPSVSTGGGGGSGKPAIHHVKETMDYSTVNYNALDLVFSEEPQLELTAGGKSMALTLSGETESGAQPRPFTAVLDTWKTEETDELTAPNALVLRAVEQKPADGETAGDEAVNTWSFTGDVYKLLGNSGVDYLVLQSGEYIVAIPTAGFTAGTQYAKLKASGVSTRKFAYTVCQDEALRETTLSVTVEGETYLLEEDRAQPMYRYDVLIGTRDMMQKPYASYMPDQNQEDNR